MEKRHNVPGEKTRDWVGLMNQIMWLGLHLQGRGKALMSSKQEATMNILET